MNLFLVVTHNCGQMFLESAFSYREDAEKLLALLEQYSEHPKLIEVDGEVVEVDDSFASFDRIEIIEVQFNPDINTYCFWNVSCIDDGNDRLKFTVRFQTINFFSYPVTYGVVSDAAVSDSVTYYEVKLVGLEREEAFLLGKELILLYRKVKTKMNRGVELKREYSKFN